MQGFKLVGYFQRYTQHSSVWQCHWLGLLIVLAKESYEYIKVKPTGKKAAQAPTYSGIPPDTFTELFPMHLLLISCHRYIYRAHRHCQCQPFTKELLEIHFKSNGCFNQFMVAPKKTEGHWNILIPRLFPPSDFDHVQIWGEESCHGRSGNVWWCQIGKG